MKQVIYKTIKELVNNQDIQIIDGDRGKNYPKKEEFKSIGFCVFLNASNIKDDTFVFENIDFISEEKDNLLRKGKLSRNDIVITTRGTVGLVAYYGDNIPYDNMRINSGMIIIRVNSNVINPNYFYQLLKSKSLKKQYQLFASGCAQPQLPIQDFRLISIPVFTKTHQDKIAKILSNYDDLIENNNKRIKILEEMAQKIYKEWFVDFKFPNHEAAIFKQTDLGSEVMPIKGKNITKAIIKKGNVPVVAGGIEPAYYHNIPNTVAPVITVSASGANAGYINLYYQDIWASDCSYIDTTMTPYVYYYYLLLKYNQIKVTNMQRGAAQPHVYPQDLAQLKIKIPEENVIREFNEIITPFFSEISNFSLKNQTLKQTRDLLLPRLISGEIDVENLEIL